MKIDRDKIHFSEHREDSEIMGRNHIFKADVTFTSTISVPDNVIEQQTKHIPYNEMRDITNDQLKAMLEHHIWGEQENEIRAIAFNLNALVECNTYSRFGGYPRETILPYEHIKEIVDRLHKLLDDNNQG